MRFDGQLIESGGPGLAKTLQEKGHDWVRQKYIEPVA
jgi:Fe-S cluster assembly ATPase SufC